MMTVLDENNKVPEGIINEDESEGVLVDPDQDLAAPCDKSLKGTPPKEKDALSASSSTVITDDNDEASSAEDSQSSWMLLSDKAKEALRSSGVVIDDENGNIIAIPQSSTSSNKEGGDIPVVITKLIDSDTTAVSDCDEDETSSTQAKKTEDSSKGKEDQEYDENLSPLAKLRKGAVAVAGGSLIAIGVPLIPTPVPGVLFIAGGLSLLGTEYPEARAVLENGKDSLVQYAETPVEGDTKNTTTELKGNEKGSEEKVAENANIPDAAEMYRTSFSTSTQAHDSPDAAEMYRKSFSISTQKAGIQVVMKHASKDAANVRKNANQRLKKFVKKGILPMVRIMVPDKTSKDKTINEENSTEDKVETNEAASEEMGVDENEKKTHAPQVNLNEETNSGSETKEKESVPEIIESIKEREEEQSLRTKL